MTLADAIAAAMLLALVLYVLLGGADFGAGLWDLLASGPRAERQRRVIDRAIAPVWEANHVWLILIVTLMFTAFPEVFAVVSISLHVPLAAMLLGIVFRGSAFVFRKYAGDSGGAERRWGRLFAMSSVITPLFLGVSIGAVTSGRIRVIDGLPTGGFFAPWLGPFPLAVGLFTSALFAYLAAVYLTLETQDAALRDDFRARAIVAAVIVGALALATGLAAGPGTWHFRNALMGSAWSWPLQMATGASAVGALMALGLRRFAIARVLAALQAALIVLGWGLAQHPFLVAPDLTIAGTAAPPVTLRLISIALAVGAAVLFPSLWALFAVFKTGQPPGDSSA